jgi:haloacetate dehalogenase
MVFEGFTLELVAASDGRKAEIKAWYDALESWCGCCAVPLSGGPVGAGHYLAEEAPGETIARLSAYFSA